MSRELERKAAFKQTVDEEGSRRRREETTRQIRKNRKEDQLRKRRMGMSQPGAGMSTMNDSTQSSTSSDSIKQATIEDLPRLKSILESQTATMEELVDATRGVRRLLSAERNPPVDAVLEAGILPFLVRNLTANPDAATLIFESAWALTNVASTSKTFTVVEACAVEPLIRLLRHKNDDVRDQAVWCLGNIAGDKVEFRDQLLFMGIVEPLLLNLTQPANMALLNNVVWTISNLCRGKPSPDMALLAPLLFPLADLLSKPVSMDVLVDVVWALSYLSDGSNDRIEKVIQTGVTSKLVEFLSDNNSQLTVPTVRCLGNFVTGSDMQTQAVVDSGILKYLEGLLGHHKKTVRKETCWLASNIAAGTPTQISTLIQERALMASIINIAATAEFEVKKEAIWTLSNICTTGSDEHVQALVHMQGMQPLADILGLNYSDEGILSAALDAVERILDVGERYNLDHAKIFDECNGIDSLESLQEHPSNSVYQKTVDIIERYFGEEEQDDENIAPETTESGTFSFGIQKQLFPAEQQQPVTFQFGPATNVRALY